MEKIDKIDKIDSDFCLDDDDLLKTFSNNLNSKSIFQKNQTNEEGSYNDLENDEDLVEYIVRIFGLNNSGKSTLMLNLINPKEGNVAEITEDFNADMFKYENSKINIWDISGKPENRKYWINYYHSSDGFIYVIDISNKSKYQESRECLELIIKEEDNKDIPLLIFANKYDKIEKEIKTEDVYNILGLDRTDNNNVFFCSAKKMKGLKEGFNWLYNKIKIE